MPSIVLKSKALSGVILEHDKYGNHLDAKGVTIEQDLELKNLQFAGRTLAEIWSDLVIDGNPVVAEFIEEAAPVIVETKSEEWKACHVRHLQYFLQIVKCTNKKCCSSFKSSYLKLVLKDFYLHLYQSLTQPMESSGLKMRKMSRACHYIKIWPYEAL